MSGEISHERNIILQTGTSTQPHTNHTHTHTHTTKQKDMHTDRQEGRIHHWTVTWQILFNTTNSTQLIRFHSTIINMLCKEESVKKDS